MFRIAEFKKIKGRQEFVKFAFSGYKIDQNGKATHYKKKVNQTDRRRKNYIEVNYFTGQTDVNGEKLYSEDFIYERNNDINGIIKWVASMGGFIIRVDAGKIEIPYSYLNKDELIIEKWGNKYQDKGRKNKWKK